MIAAARRRWATLDNDAKRALFVVGCILAVAYIGALALAVFTGSWAGFGAVSAMLGIGLFLAGLLWIATRLFPDKES